MNESNNFIPKDTTSQNKSNKKDRFSNILLEIYNLPLQRQILAFFIILYGLYTIILILFKYYYFKILNKEILSNTYIPTVNSDYLDNIINVYKSLHSISFEAKMQHFTKGINFLNIYARELNRVNLTYIDSNSNFPYEPSTLDAVELKSLNPRFTYKLKGNFSRNFQDMIQRPDNFIGHNNRILFPIIHLITPNLIDIASIQNLRIENIFTVSSSLFKNQNICINEANYFTFPKYKEIDDNFYLMDEIVDPHSICDIGKDPKLKLRNYYTKFENIYHLSDNSKSRSVLNRYQKVEDDQTLSNFFSYIISKKYERSTIRNDILTFGVNFYDDFSKHSSVETLHELLSIFYFTNNTIDGFNIEDKNFNNKLNYNIINSKDVVLTIPGFLETLYVYGFDETKYFETYDDDKQAIVNTNDIFYQKQKNYSSNFSKDAKNFNLINFLSVQYTERVLKNINTCSNYDYELSDFGLVDQNVCLPYLCKFNNCSGVESFSQMSYSIINNDCRCLPLFCGKKLDYLIGNKTNINLSQNTSSKDKEDYQIYSLLKEEKNNMKLNFDIFKDFVSTESIKCMLKFAKKKFYHQEISDEDNSLSYYALDLGIAKTPFSTQGNFISTYLIDENEFYYIILNDFSKNIDFYSYINFIIYVFLVSLLFLISLKNFYVYLARFQSRISDLNEDNILFLINKSIAKKTLLKTNGKIFLLFLYNYR